MFKVNNKITRRHSDIFIVKFEPISHFFPSVFILDSEQVNVSSNATG